MLDLREETKGPWRRWRYYGENMTLRQRLRNRYVDFRDWIESKENNAREK